MALYAFDGTGRVDEDEDIKDTNVVRFMELYDDSRKVVYEEGVGTKFGAIGKIIGLTLGSGGRSRIKDAYDRLCNNWADGDKVIDIIGFSRGAALAVHFANKIADENIKLADGKTEKAEIRFLGLWDLVASFGLSFDTVVNFQEINLGWNIDKVPNAVKHCYHALALDERRETFNVTRLNQNHQFDYVHELWFRGVHSDVGGGNENVKRSNIALQWMLDMARSSGLPIKTEQSMQPKYSEIDPAAPISENKDVQRDPRRIIAPGDKFHPTAQSIQLEVNQSHSCLVLSKLRYNWSGVQLEKGKIYQFSCPDGETWVDDDIECGPEGWSSDQLPGMKEFFVEKLEARRRKRDANWFELIGALGDEDDELFRIGRGQDSYTATKTADLYLFANDLKMDYRDNKGSMQVTIKRIS